MTIAVGSALPEAKFRIMTDEGAVDRTSDEIFKGRKVVLFGVPGAFTPTCSMNHLPGFLDNLDHFKAKGVDEIAVVAVNDPFVMAAWARHTGAKDKILFLADGNADFTKKLGLEIELGVMGLRSKRFSMIVEDGVVTALNVEDSPGTAEASGAARLLQQL
ncbi:alkyl hydroperoxide reductase [Prosthecomicrobium hirschii]|uniref:Glutathione-dependent peroxiredoxin n=1 Tax=Prosthecodimorpha hirschii TaxID=665126 RepID=A0A0P6VSQ4_9HYPH|nr:peroxiredoxin [Prosthecomicrobium hirschii]KPL54255.1 alkyl hydroperoxide reductase [Prosthecomicrobium hirschii]TPQ52750.1 peroxiredoxin [Prosthecomicrobium hirschii]